MPSGDKKVTDFINSTHDYNLRSKAKERNKLVSDSMASDQVSLELREVKDMLNKLLQRQEDQSNAHESLQASVLELQAHVSLPPTNASASSSFRRPTPDSSEAPPPGRFYKVDFPLFEGNSDPLDWLSRCDQFFQIQISELGK